MSQYKRKNVQKDSIPPKRVKLTIVGQIGRNGIPFVSQTSSTGNVPLISLASQSNAIVSPSEFAGISMNYQNFSSSNPTIKLITSDPIDLNLNSYDVCVVKNTCPDSHSGGNSDYHLNYWPNGSVIKYSFLMDDKNPRFQERQNKILIAIGRWEAHANVKFRYTKCYVNADVRISFNRGSSTSWLGRNCKRISVFEPTMNLGNIDAVFEDERGTIAHMFGHALGFCHENNNSTAVMEGSWMGPDGTLSESDKRFAMEQYPKFSPSERLSILSKRINDLNQEMNILLQNLSGTVREVEIEKHTIPGLTIE